MRFVMPKHEVRLRSYGKVIEMDVNEMLVMKSPITFDVVCKVWGDDPDLCCDSTRRAFFAVWAMLCFEWAEAVNDHRQRKKQRGIEVQHDDKRNA